jgi:hypothetical protein
MRGGRLHRKSFAARAALLVFLLLVAELKRKSLVMWQYLRSRSCFLKATKPRRSRIGWYYSVKDVVGPHPWSASIAVDAPDLRHLETRSTSNWCVLAEIGASSPPSRAPPKAPTLGAGYQATFLLSSLAIHFERFDGQYLQQRQLSFLPCSFLCPLLSVCDAVQALH